MCIRDRFSTVYKNLVYANSNLGVNIEDNGPSSNDNPDADGILNKPAVRRLAINGGNTDVTFDATLPEGSYRFDICNNPTTTGQSNCEVWLASTDKSLSGNSTLREVISIPGTGYTLSKLTMQVTRYDGETLKESSEIGSYLPMAADLTIAYGYVGQFGENVAVFPGSEISVFGQRGVYMRICNAGGEKITGFHVDENTSGANITSYHVQADQSSATVLGSMDANGNWTGTLESTQCVQIYLLGTITGASGSDAIFDPEITSSVLEGGETNVDTNPSNNSATPLQISIRDSADIKMDSRLLTEGAIVPGSEVSYELRVSNIGAGTSNLGYMMLAFILPDGAQFNGLVDGDLNDNVTLLASEDMGTLPNGCTAPVTASNVPGLEQYNGQLVQCAIAVPDGIEPGFSKLFELHVTVGTGFVSGATRAIAIALAMDEEESQEFIGLFGNGQDGFTLGLNNIAWLTYDSDPLTVTINRCNGVGEVVETDDACFTVTFNKAIYAPSFTIDDLVLDGGGTVYSFVKNDETDTSWTVRVTGMTLGGTLRLTLGAQSVQDYSAIKNGTQVLGENIVRFGTVASGETQTNDEGSAAGTNSAKGALATTGNNYDWYSPVMVILFGWALLLVTNYRKKQKVN